MTSLADPQVYASTCADLLSRMIHTVPSGVELTEVVEPPPVKPVQIQLSYIGDGTIHLSGTVRVRTPDSDKVNSTDSFATLRRSSGVSMKTTTALSHSNGLPETAVAVLPALRSLGILLSS